jgi:two-component system chemotaxis sensor kinase CheA
VTDLSGRGVGMDVVKRNIEALRGQIQLTSDRGPGHATQIRLPLTLAMIDGFLTQVGGVHYVLPLAVVSECIDVPREALRGGDRTCGTFDLRGEVLPYARPGALLRRAGRRPSGAAAWWWCATARCASAWWSTACWASTRPSSSRWPASSAT